MGRCGGWRKIIALVLAALTVNCGGTGGNSSDSGRPFTFQARGRLNLTLIPDNTADPTLTIIATLLDPQGNPFRNQRITFEAEFPDATIIPVNTPENVALACLPRESNGNATRCTNRGAAITDDNGQARVTLIAGLTLGRMRVTAEAPANLNISSAISVEVTSQGFLGGTTLAILPTSATFVNPQMGQTVTFRAVGGTPPYQWDNLNKSLGQIVPQGAFNETATYTLTGPIPTDTSEALTDTVILTDSRGASATAEITVIFAECELNVNGRTFTISGAAGGETFQINVGDAVPIIVNGVPTFTITEDFPGTAGSSQVTCDDQQRNCTITFTLPTPPRAADPDVILIRDARGCTAEIELTVDLCGNGVVDSSEEECDGSDFGPLGSTGTAACIALKGAGSVGSLTCTPDCTIDDANCTAPTAPTPTPTPTP